MNSNTQSLVVNPVIQATRVRLDMLTREMEYLLNLLQL
jgi:hypothetical protein